MIRSTSIHRRLGLIELGVVILGLAFFFSITPAFAQDSAEVWVTQASGIIDPALSGYLVETMKAAEAAHAAALVVELDTPGGLDSSMRDIIQAELDCHIPVVFYVYPQGARAASAGLYILMGADVAAMAPQTNLGAATPVSLTGDMDETMKAKVTNDAVAYIKALAETHGRNAAWAERAVREAVSLPAQEALSENVVDFVAADLPALLSAIDGYQATPKGLVLHTAEAPLHEVNMSWVQKFLHLLANPDIAYVLLIIGMLGILLELATPGLGVGGVTGAIAILLALYSFQVLPVNAVGLILIVLAMIFYLAEVKVQSHGVLAIGGTTALIVGGMLLYDTSAAFLRVSWPVLVVAAVIVLAFFALVVQAAARAMRQPHAIGMESLVHARGVVLSDIAPEGQVRVQGETWKARTAEGTVLKGEEIEVEKVEGLTLIVRRRKEAPP